MSKGFSQPGINSSSLPGRGASAGEAEKVDEFLHE
jgi:hypothetical protein